MKRVRIIALLLVIAAAALCAAAVARHLNILNRIIERLSADSRVAEAIVTASSRDPSTGKTATTIKFLEYDSAGRPLEPRYFSFPVDIIQFQALVIRFDDLFVRAGHPLKGKSAYIFTKVFSLDGTAARAYELNRMDEIPSGYRTGARQGWFERMLWRRFWAYALSAGERSRAGVKNAQLEAPGTRFIPGLIYTIRIEHDGGLRIDSRPVPDVLK